MNLKGCGRSDKKIRDLKRGINEFKRGYPEI
jgi:hypothetical protein